jgi:hypothetical protein
MAEDAESKIVLPGGVGVPRDNGLLGKLVGDRVSEWLTSQNPITVILILVLSFLGLGVHHVLQDVIPAHLKTIQDGYREQTSSFEKIQREDREAFKAEAKENREANRETIKAITQRIRDDRAAMNEAVKEAIRETRKELKQ